MNSQLVTLCDKYLPVGIAKQGSYKEVMWKTPIMESKLKGKTLINHNGQLLDILEVHTQHLSNCPCSFPPHVLRPNDLLHANGLIKESSINSLLDYGSSDNFFNDYLV